MKVSIMMKNVNPTATGALMSGLLPLLTNPITIALSVGVGGGLLLYKLFSDDDEESGNGENTVNQPYNEPFATGEVMVDDEPYEAVKTFKEPLNEEERIRQVMSMLGKRSAAARARRKV